MNIFDKNSCAVQDQYITDNEFVLKRPYSMVLFDIKTVILGIGNSLKKIRQLWDRLIFMMGIPTLKWKGHHVDKFFLTDHARACDDDNLRCIQLLKSWQQDNLSFSVYTFVKI